VRWCVRRRAEAEAQARWGLRGVGRGDGFEGGLGGGVEVRGGSGWLCAWEEHDGPSRLGSGVSGGDVEEDAGAEVKVILRGEMAACLAVC